MTPVTINGTCVRAHKFKLCSKCETKKAPEGGVDMGTRWICHDCWIRRKTSGNIKGAKS